MPTTYDTIEVLDPADDLPAWTTTWLGTDGCGNRTVYYGTPTSFTNPPNNTKDWYEPHKVVISRSPRTYHGYRGRNMRPPFRHTPHQVSKITTEEHLVRRRHGSAGLLVYYQYGGVLRVSGNCTPVMSSVETVGPRFPKWNTVVKDYAVSSYTTNGFDASEIEDAKREVEDEAARDSLSSYDLLTDLAELREVPSGIKSISSSIMNIFKSVQSYYHSYDLRGLASTDRKLVSLNRLIRMSPRQLLRNPFKIARELGSLWMGYRYSIMPLVYSYRDIAKAYERSTDVTTRNRRVIYPHSLNVSLPGPTYTYKQVEYLGNVSIRACVFQSFSSEELARKGGLGFNPIVTAWELIPLSFVADWFVNMGDYLARKSGCNWAQARWSSCSRRDSYQIKTSVHLPNQDESISINKKTPTNWWGSQPGTPPPVILDNPEGLYPLKTITVDSYSRWQFDVTGARLTLNPSLNWRRLLDSAVLSVNLLRSFIRAMKK